MNWALLILALIWLIMLAIAWKRGVIKGALLILPGAVVLGAVVALAMTIDDPSKYIVAAGGAVLAGTIWGITSKLPWTRVVLMAMGTIPMAIGFVVAQSLPTWAGVIAAGVGGGISGFSMLKAGVARTTLARNRPFPPNERQSE